MQMFMWQQKMAASGTKGNVMDAIREQALDAEVIFACGPMPMLRAIKAYAEENGILCYISLEERMACGIGACLGCVCKIEGCRCPFSSVHNKRVCKDGPVFLYYGGGDLMNTAVNYSRSRIEESGNNRIRNLWIRSKNFSEFVDLNRLGAVATKGVANVPWPGNPTPRVAETVRRHDECHRSAESGHRSVL